MNMTSMSIKLYFEDIDEPSKERYILVIMKKVNSLIENIKLFPCPFIQQMPESLNVYQNEVLKRRCK